MAMYISRIVAAVLATLLLNYARFTQCVVVDRKRRPGTASKAVLVSHSAPEGGLGYYLAPIWKLASLEEGELRTVPNPPLLFKYPRSWVQQIEALDRTKTQNFAFIGSIYKNQESVDNRRWVIEMMKHRCGDGDCFFRNTGPSSWGVEKHKWLGKFDHTWDESYALYPYDQLHNETFVPPLDISYWKTMAKAKFTLCPAGDGLWSIRFFESMLTRSIPIVEKIQHTAFPPGEAYSDKLDWKYYLLSDDPDHVYEYRDDWVKENHDTFIKYFTFLQGDNVPGAIPSSNAPNNNHKQEGCEDWCNDHAMPWQGKCAWDTKTCSGCAQCSAPAPAPLLLAAACPSNCLGGSGKIRGSKCNNCTCASCDLGLFTTNCGGMVPAACEDRATVSR